VSGTILDERNFPYTKNKLNAMVVISKQGAQMFFCST